MKLIFTIIISLIFLSNSSFAKTGSGALKLSKETMETLMMYMYGAGNKKYSGNAKRKNDPTIMAVSKSGYSYMYSYCPIEYHYGCSPPNTGRIIKSCEKYSEGSPCFIFAKKRTIVWKNGSKKVRIKKKDLKNPYLIAKKIQEAGFYDGDLSELAGIDYTTGQIDDTKNITNKKTKTLEASTNEASSLLVKELEILTKLYEDGSLTKEEFDKAKEKLLNN
jgi:hypothetical protein